MDILQKIEQLFPKVGAELYYDSYNLNIYMINLIVQEIKKPSVVFTTLGTLH